MGEGLRVFYREWESIPAKNVPGIVGSIAAIDSALAVVEEVTEVRVVRGREFGEISFDALDAVTVFWADGQLVVRRLDADSFCGSAVAETPQALEAIPPGSGPDLEIGAASEDHVVRSIGTQMVEMPDGSRALYEARMGKPLRMPDDACGTAGAQFTVRVYRDEFGRRVLSRFAALEGVNA